MDEKLLNDIKEFTNIVKNITMKKIIVVFSIALFINACKKDSSNPSSTPSPTPTPIVYQDPNLIGIWVQDSSRMDTSHVIVDSIYSSGAYRDTIYITTASYIERGWFYITSYNPPQWVLYTPQFSWNWQVNDSLELQSSVITQNFQYTVHSKILYLKGFNEFTTGVMYATQQWYHKIH